MQNGVIAAGSQLTAEAGATILREGGNAVDAAVAAAFVSFIAEIGVVHLGGSGIANIYDPQSGKSVVYDFFSNMPGMGITQKELELDFSETVVHFPGTTQSFFIGHGAVAVPGNIFGLCQLAAERGTMPLRKLIQPALKLAQDGFVMTPFQSATCRLLMPIYMATSSMRDVFFKNNIFIEEGERLLIPHLAETLMLLGELGAGEMRSGGRIGRNLTHDQATGGGLVTAQDLDAYRVIKKSALRVSYRDCDVLLPPPCSVGGVLIAFTLKLLREFDVAAMGVNSAESQALLFNAMQLTAQARHELDGAVFYGSFDQFVEFFLSADYLRFYLQELKQAMAEMTPISAEPPPPTHPNTSHLSVLDGNGLAVSITTTAGESAGHIIPNTGFIPNNMLGEADLNPLGWHKWQAGQRMPTMMSPLIVLRDGNVRLVSGSGGSERIRSALLQTIINTIDHQLPLEKAINLPRIHAEKDTVQLEFGQESAEKLASWGFPVNQWKQPSMYFGGAHSVAYRDMKLRGAGDNRRDGHVAFA